MAVRRQAYEWRNVIPVDGNTYPSFVYATPSQTTGYFKGTYPDLPYVIGHPILNCNPYATPLANPTYTSTAPSNDYVERRNDSIAVPLIAGGMPIGLFTGGHGNNIKTSAHVLDNQMVIIDSLSCWPPDANLNIFVDENYYYDAPDFSAINGLSGYTVPFPEPNYANIFTVESFKKGIDPPIYILPGSTWGVFISFSVMEILPTAKFPEGFIYYGTGQQTRAAQNVRLPGVPSAPLNLPLPYVRNRKPTWEGKAEGQSPNSPPNPWNSSSGLANNKSALQDKDIARAFVKYLLIDGADFLVAKKMMDIGLPVTEEGIQRFKQDLTRWQVRADVHEGNIDEELIRETGMTTRRSALP